MEQSIGSQALLENLLPKYDIADELLHCAEFHLVYNLQPVDRHKRKRTWSVDGVTTDDEAHTVTISEQSSL
ncbi:hypothetical protein D918_09137 [Trichuris suis]|nr:hypothetical protein D918_09137 [Trichuris suis]